LYLFFIANRWYLSSIDFFLSINQLSFERNAPLVTAMDTFGWGPVCRTLLLSLKPERIITIRSRDILLPSHQPPNQISFTNISMPPSRPPIRGRYLVRKQQTLPFLCQLDMVSRLVIYFILFYFMIFFFFVLLVFL
jgi:hypothetical protein